MDHPSEEPNTQPLARALAALMRADRTTITARWLERIAARVSVDANRVFPSDELLDHMPLLVSAIADYLEDSAATVAAQGHVMDRARELGALRFGQGFSEHEIHKEYELLGGVLFTFLRRVSEESVPTACPADVLAVAQRLFQAIAVIQQATTSEFLRFITAELREREERLHAFHRTLTHEMRNRIGATLGAGELLTLEGLTDEQREELAGVVVRNAQGMRTVMDNLLELSQVRMVPRQQRHVRLPEAVAEAVRQLRDAATRARVAVRVASDLPSVEVNAAAVELILANLLGNAVKYADPAAVEHWVEIRGRVVQEGPLAAPEVVIEVADNGLGVPEESRSKLFGRFFRAHERLAPGVSGTGLGLSIVRELSESLGGRAWAAFPPAGGSVFAVALPCRRAADAATPVASATRS